MPSYGDGIHQHLYPVPLLLSLLEMALRSIKFRREVMKSEAQEQEETRAKTSEISYFVITNRVFSSRLKKSGWFQSFQSVDEV